MVLRVDAQADLLLQIFDQSSEFVVFQLAPLIRQKLLLIYKVGLLLVYFHLGRRYLIQFVLCLKVRN